MGKSLGTLGAWGTSPLWAPFSMVKAAFSGENPLKAVDKDARKFGEKVEEATSIRLPEPPEPPEPPPQMTPAESEGIRSGELSRLKKRRRLGSAYLTKGQSRGAATRLGGTRQTLG